MKIYVDLDGVLVDFDKSFEEHFGKSPDKTFRELGDSYTWSLISKIDHFWLNMEPMPDAYQLWDFVKPYHPIILTKPARSIKQCKEDKLDWVDKYLGDVEVIFASDKSEYATPDSILIDDKEKNISAFEDAGGKAIHHISADSTIRELKKMFKSKNKKSDDFNIDTLLKISKEIKSTDILFYRKIAESPSVEKLYNRLVENTGTFGSTEFYKILESDPTYVEGSSNLGSYTLWLFNIFKNNPRLIFEDGYKVKRYLSIFDKVKGRLTKYPKDIYKYKHLADLFVAISDYIDAEDNIVDSDNQLRMKARKEKDNIEILFEDDNWKVIAPLSYEASCYWGAGTEWCTATRQTRNYYDAYSRFGSLFIFINKKDPDEKYQYHYFSRSFNDKEDRPIDYDRFKNSLVDEDFKNFLNNDLDDIAQGDAEDKYIETESIEIDKEWNDNKIKELEMFLDRNGELPSFIEDTALDYMFNNGKYEFINDGYTTSVDYYVYIDWDSIREFLSKNIDNLIAHEKNRQRIEDGQLDLFENNEEIPSFEISL